MRRERRRALERGVHALLALATFAVVLPILLIFAYLLRKGSAAFDPSFWT